MGLHATEIPSANPTGTAAPGAENGDGPRTSKIAGARPVVRSWTRSDQDGLSELSELKTSPMVALPSVIVFLVIGPPVSLPWLRNCPNWIP